MINNMLNFTVGPVQTNDYVLNIGAKQIPYFRTEEFSNIIFESEYYIKKFINASSESKVVFITGSGTASMESAVLNSFSKKDKVLIVNGGSFGQRFIDICKIHNISYDEIKLEMGKQLTEKDLSNFNGNNYTGFLVNVHETSTGVHYDMDLISSYCKKYNLFLIVDAISSFLADPFNMKQFSANIVITSSQKALACPPGISLLILDETAIKRIESNETKCFYLNLKDALKNAERGQTPFTPAVSIILQIHERLLNIDKNGGVNNEINRINLIANDFRNRIQKYPFKITSESLSNAVTPLHPLNVSAYNIFTILKNEYNIWICPNGGKLKDIILRIGHIGNLSINDNDILFHALDDMNKRGLL